MSDPGISIKNVTKTYPIPFPSFPSCTWECPASEVALRGWEPDEAKPQRVTRFQVLTLKVLKFNQQKVTVALGADVTVTSENILDMAWAADGSFVAAPSA